MLKRDRARLLIADSPTGDLERGAARRLLERLLEAYRERTVVCALDDPGLAALFDRILVFSRGRITADEQPPRPETVAAPPHAVAG